MSRSIGCFVGIFLGVLILTVCTTRAQWALDGAAICDAAGYQYMPQLVSDGSGGVIITWYDSRSGDQDIYAQRISPGGTPLWAPNGVAICTAADAQNYPRIVSDGSGGAIITWDDYRTGYYDIYAQRISADGNVMWATDGVAVCAATDHQWYPEPVSDGSGGAIITWGDWRSGSAADIYAQRISADGAVQWTTNGVAICTASGDQNYPQIVSDGSGGAIITWGDTRSGANDVYAQRISGAGAVQWTSNGVIIIEVPDEQGNPRIATDDAGGAIIVWQDRRSGQWDIYAQRISGAGAVQWTLYGVLIVSAQNPQQYPELTSDASGGAIITWEDYRNGNCDIYAQRVSDDGTTLWTYGGVAVCTATNAQEDVRISFDGSDGAIIIWRDWRSGNADIYAQWISGDGTGLWTNDGVTVCTDANDQNRPNMLPDGLGGVFAVWEDSRSPGSDIYAQRLTDDGQWANPRPAISAVLDVPADQGGKIQIHWEVSVLDRIPDSEITHYSLWRRLPSVGAAPELDVPESSGTPLSQEESGGQSIRLAINGWAWEWLADVPAHGFESYAYTAVSLYDSLGSDPHWQYFMVSGQTARQLVYYDSPLDSGYSMDNLSPSVPEGLAAEQSIMPEGLNLGWDANNEVDFLHYAVYRGLAEGFVPAPDNLIGSPVETSFFDEEWQWNSGYYYKVSALDVHGNESNYALLRPEDVTGTDASNSSFGNYLAQNYPNPFNPMTTIRFELKEPAMVSLRVYNAGGYLVRVLADGERLAGQYVEVWDGRNDAGQQVASGVYFYRLYTGPFTQTKKMIFLR
jgi:hypothetical protein